MSRLRLTAAAVVFVASLASPGVASAGILDFIWEMSGAQMIGFLANCEFDLQSTRHECRFVDALHLSGEEDFRDDRRLWLTLTGGVYFSTTKDSDTNRFDAWKVQMVAYEPTLDLRSLQSDDWKLEHGVMGLSYFFLTGKNFKRFDNIGVKLVPAAVTFKKLTVSYNFRLFPNGFTSDQFGGAPEPTANRRTELVHGFSVGYRF